MKQKVLKKICPHCGKRIYSIYQKQLEFNYNSHLMSCKKNPSNKSADTNDNAKEDKNGF